MKYAITSFIVCTFPMLILAWDGSYRYATSTNVNMSLLPICTTARTSTELSRTWIYGTDIVAAWECYYHRKKLSTGYNQSLHNVDVGGLFSDQIRTLFSTICELQGNEAFLTSTLSSGYVGQGYQDAPIKYYYPGIILDKDAGSSGLSVSNCVTDAAISYHPCYSDIFKRLQAMEIVASPATIQTVSIKETFGGGTNYVYWNEAPTSSEDLRSQRALTNMSETTHSPGTPGPYFMFPDSKNIDVYTYRDRAVYEKVALSCFAQYSSYDSGSSSEALNFTREFEKEQYVHSDIISGEDNKLCQVLVFALFHGSRSNTVTQNLERKFYSYCGPELSTVGILNLAKNLANSEFTFDSTLYDGIQMYTNGWTRKGEEVVVVLLSAFYICEPTRTSVLMN